MKKLYILMAGLILASAMMLVNNPPIFSKFSEVSEVYCTDGSFDGGKLYAAFSVVNGKCGESCRLGKKNFSLEECIKYFGAEIIITEKIGDLVSIYLYSPAIRRFKTVKGKKVNLHVAFTEDCVVMGSPVIYGSY